MDSTSDRPDRSEGPERLEQLAPLEWRLTIALDDAPIEAEVERRLAQLRPRARTAGFRPGKAPVSVLRRLYGAELHKQQWARAAHAALREALAARGLRPVAAPRLEGATEGRSVSARFEVFPELPALRFDQLKIRRPQVEIGETDVDAMIERLREREGRDHTSRRDELRESMAAELPEAAAEELAVAVESALLESCSELEIPGVLLTAQVERLRESNAAGGPLAAAALEGEARRLLGVALVLAEAARQLGLRPDPSELWRETEALAAGAPDVQSELDRIWADGEGIREIEDGLLRRRVVSAVLERAQVEDVPMRFEELVERRRERLLGATGPS